MTLTAIGVLGFVIGMFVGILLSSGHFWIEGYKRGCEDTRSRSTCKEPSFTIVRVPPDVSNS